LKKQGIFFLLLILCLVSVPVPAEGQEERWLVSYSVVDMTTRQLVLERDYETGRTISNAPMFAGAEYNITVTLDVGLSAPHANLSLWVNLNHADSIDRYWEIHTVSLNLTDDYNPNLPRFHFWQVEGRYVLSTFGRVPNDLTQVDLGNVVLHFPVDHVTLQLRGPTGFLLDEVVLTIIDSEIDSYNFFLGEREADLQEYEEIGVDPAFTDVFESYISLARSQAERGFIETAKTILEPLEIQIPPIQTGPSMADTYFLPAVGGLGLLVVLLGVLFFKARGRIAFTSMVIEDQIRELEGLTMRAARTDKSLGQRLQEINERLKDLEGI